ncbi:beta strand repeat-containing protein, partial [Amantichitinum ursilacus]|uniref:beta strand repeat-containing protein n=1 Tax=Amantichitinum ursilacus TaxID=857265 RepID=UPI000AD2C814
MKTTSRRASRPSIRHFALRAISSALLVEFSGQALAITTLPSGGQQTVNSDTAYQVLAGTSISGNSAVIVNGVAPVSFSNAGTLVATYGLGAGLQLAAQGTITNEIGGVIGGIGYAVQMSSLNANLINYGEIYAISSNPVYYGANTSGQFDNYGTINQSAPASSTADVVLDVSSNLVTINNHAGAIMNSGPANSFNRGLNQSAGQTVVQNDGVIATGREAIYLTNAATTTLTNSVSGSISSRVAPAIMLASGSQVSNYGAISTSGTGVPVILLTGSNNAVTLGAGSVLSSPSNVNVRSQGTGNTLTLTGVNTQAGDFTSDTTANGFSSLTVAASGDWTLTGNVSLGGTSASTLNVLGSLTLGGAVTQNGSGGGTTIASGGVLKLVDGPAGGSVNGAIANDGDIYFNRSLDMGLITGITGTGNVTQSGPGTLTVLTAQSYTGATTVAGGTLALGVVDALANSGSVQVASGGTLDLTSKAQSVHNLSGGGSVLLGSGTLTDSADVDGSFDGVIAGTGAFTKSGNAVLTLTGNNTATGVTTISSGTLQLGAGGTTGAVAGDIVNAGTLTINRSDAVVLSGALTGTGTLNQNGSGITTLSRATSAGAVNVNDGKLVFGQSGVFNGASMNVGSSGQAVLGSAGQLAFSGALTLEGTLTVGSNYAVPLVTADTTTLGISSILDISGFSAISPAKASELAGDRILVLQTTNGISGNFGVVNLNGATANHDYLVARGELSSDSKSYSVGTALAWTAGDPSGYGTFTLQDATDAFEVDVALANQSANANTGWDGQTLTKGGAGTLTLSAANTYTGETRVNAGTLSLTRADNINSTSAVVVASGATLNTNNTHQFLNNLSGAGNVVGGSNTTVLRNTADTEFAGVLSGSGPISKVGAGKMILSGANTATGNANIADGTLQIGNGGATGGIGGAHPGFTLSGTLIVDLSSDYAATVFGGGSFIQAGSGTTTLSGGQAGAINANAGKLVFGQTGVFNTGTLAVSGGAIAELGSAARVAATGAVTVDGTLNVAAASGAALISADSATLGAASVLNVSGLTSAIAKASDLAATQTLVLQTTNGISGSFATVNLGGPGANYLVNSGALSADSKSYRVGTGLAWTSAGPAANGVFTLPLSSAAFNVDVALANQSANGVTGWDGQTLTKAGLGTLTLSAANSYTGATQINAGTLGTGIVNSIASSSGVAVASGATLNLNGFDQSVQALTGTGAVALGSATLTINNAAAADEFAGVISGTGGVSKTGSATLVLSGNNNYSGQTNVTAGTLQIGNGGTSGGVAGAINNAATLAINRSDAYTLAGALSGSGVFNQNGSGATTLAQVGTQGDINVNAGALTFGQTGSFNAANVSAASGTTLTLGNNARLAATGAVNIDGTLGVSVSTSAPLITAASATLGAGSALTVAGFAADTSNKASMLSGSRTIVLQTTGGITGDFASVNLGSVTAPADYLVLEGEKSADSNSYSVGTALAWTSAGTAANGTFTLTQPSDAFEVDVVLANQSANPLTSWDGQTLTKAGAGTLNVSALNTYTGATQINAGTLKTGVANNLGQSSGVAVASGATLNLAGFNQSLQQLTGAGNVTLGSATLTVNNAVADTFGGVIAGSGNVLKTGAGVLSLTGANAWTGGTTVSAGTLQIGNGGTSGSVAGAINNAATLVVNRSDAYTLAGALSGTGVFNQNGSGTTTLAQVGTQGAVNVNAGGLTFGQTGTFNAASLTVATGATATIGGAAFLNATGAVNIDGTLGVSVATGAPLITAATATLGANSALNVAGFAADTSNKASDLGDSRTTVLQTTGGISGDFASVNLGGASAGGDYLVVEGAKSPDNNSYSVGTTLAWTSNGASANGSFTLTQPTDAFEVDVVLANQAANPNTGWDGQTLTKAGAGTLTLSALNSYSGATVVNAGKLQLAMADSILQSSAVTVAAGATVALGNSNQTFNRL